MNILRDIRQRSMLTCEDVNDFLVDYLEEELDEDMRRRFETHIEDCSCCHTFLEQYHDTVDLIQEEKAAAQEEIPDELAERTLAFLREHGV